MRKSVATAVIVLVSAASILSAMPASARTSGHPASATRVARCAAQFENAQRADMVSFRDFDAATWKAGHDPAAVSIFPQGQRFVGINAIMDALSGHFANQNAVWSWTEFGRHVYGCTYAFIEYDASYDIPSIGFHQRADTVVSYRYEHGKWLSVIDQGTLLELGDQ